MPHITQSMSRSVRVKAGNIVFDALLGRRGVTDEVSSVKNSFSSWDNCMNATYCKYVAQTPLLEPSLTPSRWPVIVGIIVISLILLSIITCIVRCACCGMSCCCTCFSFLKCCDCCGGCCDGKKNKAHKHLDDPYAPPPPLPHQGYQPPPPMMGGALSTQPPQYAHFEVGKSGLAVEPKSTLSEDALPPMPSWDTASNKHVEEEKNGVELEHLHPATGQSVPLMTGGVGQANTQPPSPHEMRSPYGPQPGGNGYAGVPNDSYSPQTSQTQFNGNGGYRGPSSPGPGMMGGRGQGYGSSPRNMNPQGRGYGPGSPQDEYGNDQYSGAAGSVYRQPPQRQFSNGPRPPFPPSQPSRQYSSDSSRPLNPGRQYSEQSEQSYESQPQLYNNFQPNNAPPRGPSRGPPRGPSRGPTPGAGGPPPQRMQSPPINNAAGFDFNTPYSRPTPPPQQQRPPPQRQASRDDYPEPARQYDTYNGSTSPPSYATRSPPPQEPAYPGYKPYTPPVQQRNGSPAPAVLTPGGRGREPQGWDPVR